MSKKKRLAIVLPCIIVGSLCLLYFGGGYAASLIVQEALFGKRLSSLPEEESFSTLTYYGRDDCPDLSSRQEVSFPSGGNELKGYFYQAKEAKGTFLFAHGIHGYADDYCAPLQSYLLREGYSVFAFDLTASGRSEGEGISSLAQGAYDVKAALEYLFLQSDFYAPLSNLYLAGYSWGAYSVAASLNFAYQSSVKGVLCLSGFDNPEEEMLSLARNYAGFFADFNSLTFDWGLATRCGEERHLSASEGILSSGAKACLIHGEEDKTVPLDGSIYGKLEEGGTVKKILREGFSHDRPWVSEEAKEKTEALRERASSLGLDAYRSSLGEEEKASANELDAKLLGEALDFLEE